MNIHEIKIYCNRQPALEIYGGLVEGVSEIPNDLTKLLIGEDSSTIEVERFSVIEIMTRRQELSKGEVPNEDYNKIWQN